MPSGALAHPPKLSDFILVDQNRLGGVPVFVGTRVPIRTLFVYLRKGLPIEQFIDDFEGVKPEQVSAVLEWAEADLLNKVHSTSLSF